MSLVGFEAHAKEPAEKGKKSANPGKTKSAKNNHKTPAKSPEEDRLKDYPAIKAFQEKVERARAGETVDFSGSGSATRIWFDENGVRHYESHGPPHNPYRYTSETAPDGAKKTTYSARDDGIIDTLEEQRGDGKRVKLYDTDRDGVFDKRETLMVTDDPQFFRAIDERRTPGGEWETVRNELVPTTIGCRH